MNIDAQQAGVIVGQSISDMRAMIRSQMDGLVKQVGTLHGERYLEDLRRLGDSFDALGALAGTTLIRNAELEVETISLRARLALYEN